MKISRDVIVVVALLATAVTTAAGDLTGSVVGPHGEPVAGATVEVASWRGTEGQGLDLRRPRPKAECDGDGRFVLPLPADVGDVALGVRADGYAPGWLARLAPPERSEDVTLRLAAPTPVTGRVIDATTDRGIAGARVTVSPAVRLAPATRMQLWLWWKGSLTPQFHATTDAEGRFSIDGLPPGPYVMEPACEGFGEASPLTADYPRSADAVPVELTMHPEPQREVHGVAVPAGTLRLLGSPRAAVGAGATRLAVLDGGRRVGVHCDTEDACVVDVATGDVLLRGQAASQAIRDGGAAPASTGRLPGKVITVRGRTLRGVGFDDVVHVVVAAGEHRVVAGRNDGDVEVIDTTDASHVARATASDMPLTAAVAVPGTRTIAFGTWRELVLYDLAANRVTRRIPVLDAQVLHVATEASGSRIAVASVEAVAVVDLATGEILDRRDVSGPTDVDIDGSGERVAFTDAGHVVVRHVGGAETTLPAPFPCDDVRLLGDIVAVASAATGVHLVEIDGGRDRMPSGAHLCDVLRVRTARRADGRSVAWTLSRDAAACWDTRSGERLVLRRAVTGDARDLRISADGSTCFVFDGSRGWIAFDGVTGEDVDAGPPDVARADGVRSPDGRFTVTYDDRTNAAEVRRAEDSALLLRLPPTHLFPALRVTTPDTAAFDADGSLVTAFGAGALVWDTSRRAE